MPLELYASNFHCLTESSVTPLISGSPETTRTQETFPCGLTEIAKASVPLACSISAQHGGFFLALLLIN